MQLHLTPYVILFNQPEELQRFFIQKNYTQYIIITDENSYQYCYSNFLNKAGLSDSSIRLLKIAAGEQHKTIETVLRLWQQMLQHQADRKALVINLGGGVVGDMGGFTAATYKRGIDFIQVPTTLLSMVDASVGGKLGIDLEGVKNSVGLFRDPKMVYVDTDFLKTLPWKEKLSGFAEMLKHGLITKNPIWEHLKDKSETEVNGQDVYESIQVKKDIVEKDPTEQGLRKVLNFGHTVGHAIESFCLQKGTPITHGHAIALGMYYETLISHFKLGLNETIVREIIEKLKKHYDLLSIEEQDYDRIFQLMQNDKKNEKGNIQCVLLQNIGDPIIDQTIKMDDMIKALTHAYTKA